MPYSAGRHFLQIPGPTNVPERVLRAIDRMPGAMRSEVVGAVQRVAVEGRLVERATIRFAYDALAVQDTLRIGYPSPLGAGR